MGAPLAAGAAACVAFRASAAIECETAQRLNSTMIASWTPPTALKDKKKVNLALQDEFDVVIVRCFGLLFAISRELG